MTDVAYSDSTHLCFDCDAPCDCPEGTRQWIDCRHDCEAAAYRDPLNEPGDGE